ncbi:pectin lyase-like superfamily protein [Wolffia australiana]
MEGVCGKVRGGLARPSMAITLFAVILLGFSWIRTMSDFPVLAPAMIGTGLISASCSDFYLPQPPRKVIMSIVEFGGVGDGRTSNTKAFQIAVEFLKRFAGQGGAQLNVPPGIWLTGSFNLTSNFTLFLEEGAVVLGSQDTEEWPIIEALPSYGRGRERPGGRHSSLLHANGVSNLVITGQNGSVDGQGKMWWDMWRNRTLIHTRGHLVEVMNSRNVLISNLTFRNSPFWTIHPVYCSNVVVKNVTVLAPLDSPNTDGIDPDSCTRVCVEDCYIESGDDLVAVKSGWDQYGMAVAQPSSDIVIRRVSGTTPTCSGVGIGSEMSGGVSNIHVEDLRVWNSASAVRLKTDRGRGGYITNITIANIAMERVKIPIRFSRGADDHPDDAWDAEALPRVSGVFISNVTAVGVLRGLVMEGVQGAVYEKICMSNVSLHGLEGKMTWRCEFVSGDSRGVYPSPCPQLRNSSAGCFG